MKKEYLAESGHGFIEFDPNITVVEYDEERPEDSRDHLEIDRVGRSIRYLQAKYGYDISTAREHLQTQGLDFEEVEWWEEIVDECELSKYPAKPYEFTQKDFINPYPGNTLYLKH